MPQMITEQTSMDYDVRGDGPPLVLINGLGFGRWGFFKQIPAFSRRFSTITFDVRGERDLKGGVADLTGEVVALLDHLNIRKAHVMGTSLGGFVAQELALKRPDLVDRLVLVCTSYGRGGPETMSPWALKDMIGVPSLSVEGAVRERARGCHFGGLPLLQRRGLLPKVTRLDRSRRLLDKPAQKSGVVVGKIGGRLVGTASRNRK